MVDAKNPNRTETGTRKLDKVVRQVPRDRRGRLVRFLSRPLLLEESGPPRVLSHLIYTVGFLAIAGVVWASQTEVSETAFTHGQIMPTGSVRLVEHLEGGIISQILVEDGQVVRQGELLMTMRSVDALAEQDRLRVQEAALSLRAERLRAFVMNRAPDFTAGTDFPDLAADQVAILELQNEARASQREVLLSRVGQRELELKGLEEQRLNIEEQIAITTQQSDMRRNLVEKGLDSQVNLLDVERRLSEVRGQLVGLIGEASRTREARHEAESALIELEATLRNDALAEMGEVTAQLAEVREIAARLDDRVQRLRVVAPVDGIVKGIVSRTAGSVVDPGEALMEIVPMDESLVAEVRILPRDVGHLRVGQAAKVKITSYEVTRFGAMKGELALVSASTFQDEDGEPFYKGVISLDKLYLGSDPNRNLLLPGMVVDADIRTGTKTLLQYLLKPVFRAFDSSFSER